MLSFAATYNSTDKLFFIRYATKDSAILNSHTCTHVMLATVHSKHDENH